MGEKKTQSLFQPYLDRFKNGDFDNSKALLREALFNEVVLPLYKGQYGELQGYIKAIETMQLVSLRQYRCGAVRLFQPTQFKPLKQKSQISLVFGMNALVPLGTIKTL
ncbi:hypothetical protein E5P80_07275 [Helicobacter pylori]|nr:hypothetical protein E5P80_07240 [Helicobacter pylori]WQX33350.1 hypothetical protein E5P80_07275 [Helicobacter pylori]